MTTAQGRQGQRHDMALLIDGDNAQASLIAEILAETAKYGTITVRRVYGDWTSPQMAGWKKTLHAYAVRPQQFPHTAGKNATDSGFTRLAIRIREQGLFVIGIGRPETPESFVRACEVFVYTTNLVSEREAEGEQTEEVAPENEARSDGKETAPRTVEKAVEPTDGNIWIRTVKKSH